MDRLNKKEKTEVIKYLRNLPAKECEDILNYIFIMKDPETGKNIDSKMHKALIYKIQRRLDKQIVDLCGFQSIQSLRQYLERAYIKVYNYINRPNQSQN